MEHEFSVTRIVNVCCDKCGSDDVAIPDAEHRDDLIICNACGADNGTRAALEEQVAQQDGHKIADDLGSSIADMFKGSPNVRVVKD